MYKGDEVFYTLEGSISVIIASPEDSESVTKSRFEVKCGERFLIPEGVVHRYLNLTTKPVKLIFGIAPEL